MKPEDEEQYWCNRTNEIIMARHEPHPFWDDRIWTHPVDMVRFASILFVIVMGIFRIAQLVLLGGVP